MAVTITASELAEAAQLTPAQAARLLVVASALVVQFAPGAPEAVLNEAVVRTAGWLGHTPAGSLTRVETGPRSSEFAASQKGALRHSGAMSLLSPWKVRRGGAI